MSLQSRLASPPPLGHPGRLSPVTETLWAAGQDNNRRAGRQASNETADPLIIFVNQDRKLNRPTSVPFQFLNFSSEEVKHPWSLGAGKNRETEDESMQLVKANINPDNPGCLTSNTLRATTQHFFACRLNPSMSNAIPLLFQFQFVKS